MGLGCHSFWLFFLSRPGEAFAPKSEDEGCGPSLLVSF